MWENPATQRNITQLKADNISVLGPDSGDQACGETGLGRMLEAEDLLALINAHFTPKLLADKRVLITAGATIEMIDPVRAITNLSSGKMGYAIAQTAADMGAEVTLVSGATTLAIPKNVNHIVATSAEKMYQAVMSNISKQDIFISVAAVADYSPVETADEKIKKSDASLVINLKRNQDILADVTNLPNAPFCVGFAAETQNLIAQAEQKRLHKKLPLLVANLVNESMGQDEANITLLDNQGAHPLPKASKVVLSTQLLMHLSHLLNNKSKELK